MRDRLQTNLTSEQSESPFQSEITAALTRLRKEFTDVIAATPGDISKSADLHRALRIDRKLSWKVFKVANAMNPVSAGLHVPSPANMTTFLKAAAKCGVPQEMIDSLSHVAEDFEAIVTRHAGDRATFESMVSALAPDENTEQLDLAHRRFAFRGQRHILGLQAKTQLKCVMYQPNEDPTFLDVIKAEGFVDLRRLRFSAPLTISYSGARNDNGSPRDVRLKPLEPVTNPCGMSLLREFCSDPLPEFREVVTESGFVRGELVTHDVGNRAAVTYIEGHSTVRALPRYRSSDNWTAGVVAAVRIPCEILVHDMLVHRNTYGKIKPEAIVHADNMNNEIWHSIAARNDQLPFTPEVRYLGRGPSVLHTPDVPRYAELGEYLFKRTGWDGDQFDVFRCRIEYPVMPASVEIRFDLPEAPTQ